MVTSPLCPPHPFPKLKLSKQTQVLKTLLSEENFFNASANMKTNTSFKSTLHGTYKHHWPSALELFRRSALLTTLFQHKLYLLCSCRQGSMTSASFHPRIHPDSQDIYRKHLLPYRLLLYKPSISQLRSSVLFVCMPVPAGPLAIAHIFQELFLGLWCHPQPSSNTFLMQAAFKDKLAVASLPGLLFPVGHPGNFKHKGQNWLLQLCQGFLETAPSGSPRGSGSQEAGKGPWQSFPSLHEGAALSCTRTTVHHICR